MDNQTNKLTDKELLHLAIQSTQAGDHEKAIIQLKRSLEIQESAAGYFLLAAEHAEIGMFEEAINEIKTALEMDENLHIARFQLGLMYLTTNQGELAQDTFSKLIDLPDNDPLKQFADAMLALFDDDLEKAASGLENGIKLNTSNLALNKDMQGMLTNIQNHLNNGKPDSEQEPETGDADKDKVAAGNYFLSNYGSNDTH